MSARSSMDAKIRIESHRFLSLHLRCKTRSIGDEIVCMLTTLSSRQDKVDRWMLMSNNVKIDEF